MRTDQPGFPSAPWPEALERFATACGAVEDALFETIPILGEPLPQQALDAWVDHGVGLARALADHALELHDRRAVLGLDTAATEDSNQTVVPTGTVATGWL